MLKKSVIALFWVLILSVILFAGPNLIIRCDDIGMSHSVNAAAKELLDTGLPVNYSVMFPCGWVPEAVEIMKKYDNVSIGVHLVLNSEWQEYKWGPVSGGKAVPSLVDKHGYFFPTRALFEENNPKFEEIETELRAQIERALQTGLRISYMDYHMGTAASTAEYQELLMKLAKEYKIGISRFYGEQDSKSIYSVDPEIKKDSLVSFIKNLPKEGTYLMVFHIGRTFPEMKAMTDTHPWGLKEMSRHRQAELEALTSPEFRFVLKKKKVNIVTYDQLLKEKGPEQLKNPF
jgi:hypothetical protein